MDFARKSAWRSPFSAGLIAKQLKVLAVISKPLSVIWCHDKTSRFCYAHKSKLLQGVRKA
jgi:hypothetical protein